MIKVLQINTKIVLTSFTSQVILKLFLRSLYHNNALCVHKYHLFIIYAICYLDAKFKTSLSFLRLEVEAIGGKLYSSEC